MKEYVSVFYRFQLELDKRNLIDRLCKYNLRSSQSSFEFFKINEDENELKFPPRVLDEDYYNLYRILDLIVDDCLEFPFEFSRDLDRRSFFTEDDLRDIKEFVTKIDYEVSEFYFEIVGFISEFRFFAKKFLQKEINHWIKRVKQSKELRIKKVMRGQGLDFENSRDQKMDSQIILDSFEDERKVFKNNSVNFLSHEEVHSHMFYLPYNYFLYEKELIDCYLEVWDSVDLGKESLEDLIVFSKVINFLFNEDLIKYIRETPKKIKEWGPHDFESMDYHKKSNFDNPYYNDQLDLDQQSPEFWDSI